MGGGGLGTGRGGEVVFVVGGCCVGGKGGCECSEEAWVCSCCGVRL